MRSEALLELARQRFRDDWTDADETLFRQTGSGAIADYGEGDPTHADKWGKDRVLRADRIEWLCTDRDAVKEVTHKGVQIKGTRIDGELTLSFAQIPFPLGIMNSAIRERILLQHAHLPALSLSGTHTGPINAGGLSVEHVVFMRDGFQATGEVRLVGATIGGTLDCGKGQFSNPDGCALIADGIEVKGGVFLRDKFQATGEVRLLGAKIGVNLECDNARLSNPNGKALSADGIEVGGGVLLRNEFEATGEVRLLNAKIGGNLDCTKANFSNPDGWALSADGVDVKGTVFLSDGFQATGGVRLPGATIGGDLACIKGRFSNPNGRALSADGVDVKGTVFLSDGFQATGGVRLLGAKIGGTLDCSKGHFSYPYAQALSADEIDVTGGVFLCEEFQATGEVRLLGAKIGGDLACVKGRFSNPDGWALSADKVEIKGSVFMREQFQAQGLVAFPGATVGRHLVWEGTMDSDRCTLDLRSAKIGTLWDEEASWPAKLYLDGLVYDRLDNYAPLDPEARLRWLALQDKDRFIPQPYVQLAKVLKEMGHEADARKILIAKQEDPARVRNLTIPRRVWHHVLGLTIGYGYRPWQALLWILGFILLGTLFFGIGSGQGLLVETKEGTAPTFNTLVYSVDAFVPLVDLHQAKYRLPAVWWLRGYHWLHIGMGWVLTTLLVVGLTGLVQK